MKKGKEMSSNFETASQSIDAAEKEQAISQKQVTLMKLFIDFGDKLDSGLTEVWRKIC